MAQRTADCMNNDTQEAFNKAHDYCTYATIQQQSAHELLAFATQHLNCKEQKNILEVGCGGGALTRLLHSHCPHAQITALDFAPTMLATARTHCPQDAHLHWQLGDIATYRYPQIFDCIYANFSLQWLNEPMSVYTQMLKHSKALCFAVPLASSFIALRNLCQDYGVHLPLVDLPTYEDIVAYTNNACMHDYCRPYWMMFNNPLEALMYFKKIGAHANKQPPTNLLRLRHIAQPISMNFDVAHCLVLCDSTNKTQ